MAREAREQETHVEASVLNSSVMNLNINDVKGPPVFQDDIYFVDDDLNLVETVLEDDDSVNANVTSGCPLSQAILATQAPDTVMD
ncbi:MAG: hypothetical protein M1830_009070 [Pleopsidium flavum]|nr:MAG: hypothetical protein M1830_009070 [Pleopsidium flavum]